MLYCAGTGPAGKFKKKKVREDAPGSTLRGGPLPYPLTLFDVCCTMAVITKGVIIFMKPREPKVERLVCRVTTKDKVAIEKAAARSGMNLSEYMRACTLTMMVAEFEPHALRVLGSGIAEAVSQLAGKLKMDRRAVAVR